MAKLKGKAKASARKKARKLQSYRKSVIQNLRSAEGDKRARALGWTPRSGDFEKELLNDLELAKIKKMLNEGYKVNYNGIYVDSVEHYIELVKSRAEGPPTDQELELYGSKFFGMSTQ